MPSDLGLVRYDAMCAAIAESHRVDEVKNIRDKAKAIEVYAQQARNYEAERKAAEIRIRAERRAGELLREMTANGQRQKPGDAGGKNKKHTSCDTTNATPSLQDLGITRDQSSKWQQLANVPEEEFDRAVGGDGPKPTTEGIINAEKLRRQPAPRMDDQALWLWGRIRDFDRKGILERDIGELISGMTDSMQEDCKRIAPGLLAWLQKVMGIHRASVDSVATKRAKAVA